MDDAEANSMSPKNSSVPTPTEAVSMEVVRGRSTDHGGGVIAAAAAVMAEAAAETIDGVPGTGVDVDTGWGDDGSNGDSTRGNNAAAADSDDIGTVPEVIADAQWRHTGLKMSTLH